MIRSALGPGERNIRSKRPPGVCGRLQRNRRSPSTSKRHCDLRSAVQHAKTANGARLCAPKYDGCITGTRPPSQIAFLLIRGVACDFRHKRDRTVDRLTSEAFNLRYDRTYAPHAPNKAAYEQVQARVQGRSVHSGQL